MYLLSSVQFICPISFFFLFSLYPLSFYLIVFILSSQVKADEIAKLMNENEQLKALIDDLRVSGDTVF